ncbi:MAG: hypothetical protein HY305_02125 [Sphingobacteriales bacterium]|nr:hypothetical protein [Sphingobacteriales bacterium]
MIYKMIQVRWITILFICIAVNNIALAQTVRTPQQIIESLYKQYDSLPNVTFDVEFRYTSDTLNGNFTNEVLEGTYTMAGKRARYTIGDIEYMQNDSFFIAVYNKDKFIMVSNTILANTGKVLPAREAIDSLLYSYGNHYTITAAENDTFGIVNFAKADSLAQFLNFAIRYRPDMNYIKEIAYDFEVPYAPVSDLSPVSLADADSSGNNTVDDRSAVPLVIMRRNRLQIQFATHRLDNFSRDIYSENNYIYFEGEECLPVPKYRDYNIRNSYRKIY